MSTRKASTRTSRLLEVLRVGYERVGCKAADVESDGEEAGGESGGESDAKTCKQATEEMSGGKYKQFRERELNPKEKLVRAVRGVKGVL